MKLFTALKLFILVLVLLEVNAKRYSGGSSRGSSRGSSSSSRGSWFGGSKPKPSSSLPTSFKPNNNKPSSLPTSFGNKPSQTHSQAPVRDLPSRQPVHENHQQNSAKPVNSHLPEYGKQPSSNPSYNPSGGYPKLPSASAPNPPYPSGLPNHPHPSATASHVPNVNSAPYHPSFSHPPAPHGVSYPQSFNPGAGSYHPGGGSYHPGGGSYHPGGGSYHPSTGGGFGQPHYQPAPQPNYAPTYHSPPATQAFVPGRTVYVDKPSKGPGLGTYIASGVAGGVAAGATNAIVDHAISSIFRPSSNHIHTYPSAPVVGTPTSTHTVNNYYYGNSGPGDSTPNNGNNNNNGPSNYDSNGNSNNNNNNGPSNYDPNNNNNNNYNNNGPNQGYNGGNQPSNPQASPGGVSNVANNDGKGNPSSFTNGIVSRTPEAAAQAEKDDPISDLNLMKLTEELFEAQDKNLYPLMELNLQKRVTPNSNPNEKVPDEAPDRLFTLKPELDSVPTVTALRALYDNYERDGTKPENLTPERERKEEAFVDEIMKTQVMSKAMDWLVNQKYVEPRESEKKDTLKRMWFSTFENTSSGIERIFLSERFGNDGIVGMQNWLYFAHLESQNKVNYLGYVDNSNLSGKGQLLKLNYETDGFTMRNATIFVGTTPELEVALYTVCFYARPNNWCPVSLGGAKFFVLTHLFKYYQKDLIDLGFPAF